LAGTEYFYVNPLHQRAGAHPDHNRSPAHGRRGWFDCACCPPNVMRTLASLDGYLATSDEDGIQIQLYAPSTIEANGTRLEVETDYPWNGRVRVRILETRPEQWTLSLRVPAWADGARLDGNAVSTRLDGNKATGYAAVRKVWQAGDTVELILPMPVRLTTADERIDAVRGCVAIERGPLVYAVEGVDAFRLAGVGSAAHKPDLLEGVTVVPVSGRVPGQSPYSSTVEVEAVPYFAWANRGIGPMRVWLPDGRQ
jgi:hypothetical protein